MSSRDRIAMTDAEVTEFLDAGHTLICATNGRDGWPHLMPLWYVVRDGELWAWTYGKSQKARNLERDPRATLQVEAGEAYDELRGVMIRAETEIHRDVDLVTELGAEIFTRYGGGRLSDEAIEGVRRQAPKRIGLQFHPHSRASWDHRKA